MIDYNLYYDWPKTFSYGAFINMIIGGRSIGKTYGLRYESFKDFVSKGYRFCEICRYENEMTAVGSGYFDKMQSRGDLQFNGKQYTYKYKGGQIYLAELKPVDNKDKLNWQLAGYLVSLSTMQKIKKQTFANIRNIVMDEAIIDRDLSPYNRYLKNEYMILVNTLSSLIRETPGERTKARVFLLGNAVDFLNPYFQAFNMKDLPEYGFHWYKNKMVLVHMLKDAKLNERVEESMLAKLLSDTVEFDTMFENKFRHADSNRIRKKTPVSQFRFSVLYKGTEFGIWIDRNEGIFISNKVPKNNDKQYIITIDDFKDAGYLDKKIYVIHTLDFWFRNHQLYFESTLIEGRFLDMLKELESYK